MKYMNTIDRKLAKVKADFIQQICDTSTNLTSLVELGDRILLSSHGIIFCKSCSTIHYFNSNEVTNIAQDLIKSVYAYLSELRRGKTLTKAQATKIRSQVVERYLREDIMPIVVNASKLLRSKRGETLALFNREMFDKAQEARKKQLEKDKYYTPPKKPKGSAFTPRTSTKIRRVANQHLIDSAKNHHLLMEFYTCHRKLSHAFEDEAMEHLQRLHQEETEQMDVYLCVFCTGYHVGHKPSSSSNKTVKNAHKYWSKWPEKVEQFLKDKSVII